MEVSVGFVSVVGEQGGCHLRCRRLYWRYSGSYFADEGASVFLADRTESTLKKVADDIYSDGGHTAGNPVLKPNPQTESMDSRKPRYVVDVIL